MVVTKEDYLNNQKAVKLFRAFLEPVLWKAHLNMVSVMKSRPQRTAGVEYACSRGWLRAHGLPGPEAQSLPVHCPTAAPSGSSSRSTYAPAQRLLCMHYLSIHSLPLYTTYGL